MLNLLLIISFLDLTVNPDFSQVEVDQQVTNLSRFEITLPKKDNFY